MKRWSGLSRRSGRDRPSACSGRAAIARDRCPRWIQGLHCKYVPKPCHPGAGARSRGVARAGPVRQYPGLFSLRDGLRAERQGRRRSPQPLRWRRYEGRVPFAPPAHPGSPRVLGWRPPHGRPYRAYRGRPVGLPGHRQPPRSGWQDRQLHRRRLGIPGIHPSRQHAPLGLQRKGQQRPVPGAPLDGRQRAAFRHHGRGRISRHGRLPRRSEVQSRPRLRHFRSAGRRLLGPRCPQPGLLPAPRSARALPEPEGHHRRPGAGRRPRLSGQAVSRLGGAPPLRPLRGWALRRHGRHLAGRRAVRRLPRRARAAQGPGRPDQGFRPLPAPPLERRPRNLHAPAGRRLDGFRRLPDRRRQRGRHRAPGLRRAVRECRFRPRGQRGREVAAPRCGCRHVPPSPVERRHGRPVGNLRQHRIRPAISRLSGRRKP